jgi:hypothetical protein
MRNSTVTTIADRVHRNFGRRLRRIGRFLQWLVSISKSETDIDRHPDFERMARKVYRRS